MHEKISKNYYDTLQTFNFPAKSVGSWWTVSWKSSKSSLSGVSPDSRAVVEKRLIWSKITATESMICFSYFYIQINNNRSAHINKKASKKKQKKNDDDNQI